MRRPRKAAAPVAKARPFTLTWEDSEGGGASGRGATTLAEAVADVRAAVLQGAVRGSVTLNAGADDPGRVVLTFDVERGV